MQEHPETISHTSYALGFIYLELGRYEDSITAFRCFIQHQRDWGYIHIEIGIDYYYLRQYDAAIEEILQGVSTCAGNARAFYYLALAYWKSGESEQARYCHSQLQVLDAEMAARLSRESEGYGVNGA